MRYRFRRSLVLGALMCTAFLVFLVGSQPVHGIPLCFTTSASSYTITQGTTLTVTGADTCANAASPISINLLPNCGSLTALANVPAALGVGGQFSANVPTSSLTPGSYCIQGSAGCSGGGCTPPPVILDPLTVTPPIPEYPLGLPLLAILTVVGYGLVRRRTRNDNN